MTVIDDIFDSSFGFLFRILKAIIKDILFDIACYLVGWIFLKVLTLGKYPNSNLVEGIRDDHANDILVSFVGLSIILVVSFIIFSL